MSVNFTFKALTAEDVPLPASVEFDAFLDRHFDAANRLANSLDTWHKGIVRAHNTTQSLELKHLSDHPIRADLGLEGYWCARESFHTAQSVSEAGTLYDRFKRGLLEQHSQQETDYIESCQEAKQLQVFRPDVAEVWRMQYKTPALSSSRVFVVLLLSREISKESNGERSFINLSLPFDHPDAPENQGAEKSFARGKYVSVERVKEVQGGAQIEWRMATTSDAGGMIPQWVTNKSLPGTIAEDVPSFISWLTKKYPEGGEIVSKPTPS